MEELKDMLEKSLERSSGEMAKVMMSDFRSLEAIFVCKANDMQTLCVRYAPGLCGCTFFQNGRCENKS